MSLMGHATIFNLKRKHPPRANPLMVTVFWQRGQVRYQFHDTSAHHEGQDPIWGDSRLQAQWWEKTFQDRERTFEKIEPLVVLYRLRVYVHA